MWRTIINKKKKSYCFVFINLSFFFFCFFPFQLILLSLTSQDISRLISTAWLNCPLGKCPACVPDKPTVLSVYQAFIDPVKATRMKAFDFSHWPERLAQAPLPERNKHSFAITIRWFLSFCRRGRGEISHQSARDFIAWAGSEKKAKPWQIEEWKEALNWFFREAKRLGFSSRETSNIQHRTSNLEGTASQNLATGTDR